MKKTSTLGEWLKLVLLHVFESAESETAVEMAECSQKMQFR